MKRRAFTGPVMALVLAFALLMAMMAIVSADNPYTFTTAGGTMGFADGAVTVTVPQGATGGDVEVAYAPESADSVTIALIPRNSSGQSGTATLTAMGAETQVVVSLSSGALESELIHIHDGQCGSTLGGIAKGLTSFTGGSGQSVSTVDVTLASIRGGANAINVHKAGEAGTYTACGNIPGDLPAPMGTAFGSQMFSLTTNPVTTFSRAVNVTVAYSAADVSAAGGNVNNVKLYIWDAAFSDWNEVASAIRDSANSTLTTQQTSLGTYALGVVGATAAPPTATATPAPPESVGDWAPGTGLLLGLLLAGAALALGGGYLLFRRPRNAGV